MSEQEFINGERSTWRQILHFCLSGLGYQDPEAKHAQWILERESAIRELRDICKEFGDNDWGADLNLADIIDKHLGRHLQALREN